MANYRPLGELVDRRGRWVLLISLLLAHFMGGLNQFLVATATPRMLVDLGGFNLLPWVFTAYLLGSTVAAPIVGRLSDIYGRRSLLAAAIVFFLVGALGCGLAPSMPLLIVARGVQGVGGGMILACVIATLADLFAPAERGKYFGIFIGAQTVAGLSGPAIGGVLTDYLSWRWVFFLNLPLASVALAFIWFKLPKGGSGGSVRDIDFRGAILLAVGSTLLLLGLTWAQRDYGWASAPTLALLAGSALATGSFILSERANPRAILPLSMFRTREFAVATFATVLFSAATQGTVQYLPTFVQVAMGSSATISGLITTPQALATFVASLVGGFLMGRSGRYRTQCVGGAVIATGAAYLLHGLDAGEPQWHIAAFMFVLGLGGGLVTPTLSIVSQNALPQELVGAASGARMFFMQIGTVLGVALFGSLLSASYHQSFEDRTPPAASQDVPAPLLREFDDPTLPLNSSAFERVKSGMADVPNGTALLDELVVAQRQGVTTATRHVFLGATAVLALASITLVLLKDVPLRRTLSEPSQPEPVLAPVPAASARRRLRLGR